VNVLKEYQTKTGVDPARLKSLVTNLVNLRNDLSTVGGNYMGPLRDSEFLSAIKHRSAIPGGTCDFDLPDYSYWLNRPAEVRAAEFDGWLALIRPLCDSIAELLWLTPAKAKCKSEVAAGGIFQLQFDRENPCQLVRVTLPPDSDLFPEISGSQHRCTIRFLNWLDANQPTRTRGSGRAVSVDVLALDPGHEFRWQRSSNAPTCKRPGGMSPESVYRPFCSDRCRLIDLGAWFMNSTGFPMNPQTATDELPPDSSEES